MKTDYTPIDCGFYDYLEAFTTTKKTIEINYFENNISRKTISLKAKIKNLETKNGEEFIIFQDENSKEPIKIRLDKLLSVESVAVSKGVDACQV